MQKKLLISIGLLVLAGAGAVLWNGLRHDNAPGGRGGGTSNPKVSPVDAPEALSSRIVELKDGQSFDLAITPVKKVVAGRTVDMLAYNGSIPGPTLRVPEGAEIRLNLKNGGDMATSLHAHGVRMDNAFDGVPGVTQKEIAPGEAFTYTLKFPDAGIFWYHPHVRTDYALESGLYANIIVTPKDAAYWSPTNREIALMLDDIALDKNGLLPFSDKTADHTLMGRFGNVMLVNGVTDYELSTKQGEVVRLYLTNAANTRLFNFTLPGAKMKLVGADVGRYAKETFVNEVLLSPGERRVVDVIFEKSGTFEMVHRTPGKEYALGKVTVAAEQAAPDYAKSFSLLRTNASVADEMQGLMSTYLDKAPDKRITLSLEMNGTMQNMMKESNSGMMGGGHMMGNGMMMSGSEMGMDDDDETLEWEDTMAGMNTASNADMMKWKLVDDKTGLANTDIADWKFRQGDKVKIRVFNDPKSLHPMQHPIHFHGQNLMVLAKNGVPNDNPAWVDTVLVGKGETVDILLDASNPGTWVAHCHVLEHAEAGMMLTYTVGKTE